MAAAGERSTKSAATRLALYLLVGDPALPGGSSASLTGLLESGDGRPDQKDLPLRVLPTEQGLASEHSNAGDSCTVATHTRKACIQDLRHPAESFLAKSGCPWQGAIIHRRNGGCGRPGCGDDDAADNGAVDEAVNDELVTVIAVVMMVPEIQESSKNAERGEVLHIAKTIQQQNMLSNKNSRSVGMVRAAMGTVTPVVVLASSGFFMSAAHHGLRQWQ